MTQSEYNQQVTRCAQFALGLAAGNPAAAKSALAVTLSGTREAMLPAPADMISVLLYSGHPHAADSMSHMMRLSDAAWAAHLADVSAKIDTLP